METLVVIAAAKPDDFTNTVLNHVLVKLDHIPQVGERFVKPVTLQWIFFITCTCKIARLMTHGLIWHVATMPACAKITTKGVGWWLSTCPINGGVKKKWFILTVSFIGQTYLNGGFQPTAFHFSICSFPHAVLIGATLSHPVPSNHISNQQIYP